MISQALLLSIASSFVFKRLPVEVVAQLLNLSSTLEVINEYTQETYGDKFWDGSFTKDSFNTLYRVVCPPTSMDFDMSVGFPFCYKTIFVERYPFTEGKNYAKFGIHKKLKKPLLSVKD
jgi:hypothetical protein